MDESNQIVEFRKRFQNILQDISVSIAFDTRDVSRIEKIDKYVSCFINWKKGNIDAAVNLAVDVLKWRKEKNINDITVDKIDENLLKRGIVFVHGTALDETRIVYFIVRLQTKDIKEEVQRILCLWLERLHHQETGRHITFLLDVSKSGMSNVDLGAIKFLLDCFSTYFPDMLAIWKIVKQWMTEDQRRRTVFCSFKDIKQYIDPENLLTYMGGKDTWEYKYPPEKDEVPFLDQVNDFCFVPEASAGVTPAAMFSELYDSQTELDDVTCDVTEDGITASDSDIQNPYQQVGSPHYGYNIDTSYNDYLTPRTLQKRELIRSKKATINKTDKFNYSSPANPADADERRKTKSNYYTNFVNGINLKSLLIMSPATDVIFRKEYVDERTGRYVSYITLTNLTRSEQVAFKIKTNSPDHYLVKPNSGYVSPGDTVTIFIYMNPGYEYSLSKDRFLVLYQKKGNATSVKEFWRTHVSKDSHFEHRVQVKFIKSSDVESEIANLDSSISGEPVPYSALNRSPSLQNNQMIPSNFASPSNKVQKEMSDAELQLLAKEVFDLKNTMLTMESNSDRLRSKLRFSLIMHCFVIFLLFYVVLKLFVLTSLLQLGQSWQ